MLLSIPMAFSVYTIETEMNDRCLSVFEYLQRYLYYVQVKICMYTKRIGYVQGNVYVHKKNFWDLHREGGPLI